MNNTDSEFEQGEDFEEKNEHERNKENGEESLAFGLKFIIVFFLVDAIFRLIVVFSSADILRGFDDGIGGFVSAIFDSPFALIYLLMVVFNLMLALQIYARMLSGRVWAIVFSFVQIFNLIADPLGIYEVALLGALGRIQLVVGVGVFSFTIYYCLFSKARLILRR